MIIDWLQPVVDEECARFHQRQIILQRNTVQSDRGGSDIVGLPWLAAEVKNVEQQNTANLEAWWQQAVEQAQAWSTRQQPLTPVLFYIKACNPIRCRLWGHAGWSVDYQGGDEVTPAIVHVGVPCLVDVEAGVFEVYLRQRLAYEFTKHSKK